MIRGRKGGHLVSIPGILEEKEFYFLRDLVKEVTKSERKRKKRYHTCAGDKSRPHSWTSLVNVLYGPHFSILRSLPKTESSSYVMPISA